nr:leucine-rich repeat protein SHOC-2-like [Lytechinus pictus]
MMSTSLASRSFKRSFNPHRNHGTTVSKLRLLIDVDPTYGFRRLKLGGRELDDLPRELFELTELEYLTLSPDRKSCLFFQLSSVPKDIGRLVNLRVLCLDTNELTDLHPALCQLGHLERLVLSNNLLTKLPQEFEDLKQLKSLHIANNYFEEVPEPLFALKQLTFLDMSDNRIMILSSRIGELRNLETLLLFYNLLEMLPESIGRCTRLSNLWFGMNKLTTLPHGVGRLSRLDWGEHDHSSNLEGNPLIYPPIQVCRRGPVSIYEYFKERGTSNKVTGIDDDDDDIMSDESGSTLGDAADYRMKTTSQTSP